MNIDWPFVALLAASNFILLAGLGAFSRRPAQDDGAAPRTSADAPPPRPGQAMTATGSGDTAAPEPACTTPPTRADVAMMLEQALAAQREDMHKREADMAYWGDTGYWVRVAIAVADPVLLPVPAEGDLHAWLLDRRDRLEEVRNEFRREQDDPDGFGLGTLGELQRDLDAIIARFA